MYKPELKDQINQKLQEFFQLERGNRITPNNWGFLQLGLEIIFKQNMVEPEKEEPSGD